MRKPIRTLAFTFVVLSLFTGLNAASGAKRPQEKNARSRQSTVSTATQTRDTADSSTTNDRFQIQNKSLTTVSHDATLTGDGTSALPLGVAVPLSLTGSSPGLLQPILTVQNTGASGAGVTTTGGDDLGVGRGGPGVNAAGGSSTSGQGGTAVRAFGGSATSGAGGIGVGSLGGGSDSGFGGTGMLGIGGDSGSGRAGRGVEGLGGNSDSGNAGIGVFAVGGSSGPNQRASGIQAFGGDSNSSVGGDAVYAAGGVGPLGNGLAGNFQGNVTITGNLSKGGGSFKIDHPLDPENKYLYHSFVESPDMMNIYNGNIITDENGNAVVELPSYFEALNQDFRYQLTAIGTFAQAIVAEEIKGNRFTIKTNAPGVKVSWQVTGVRQDAFARKNRIKVEVEKDEKERGFYLHAEAFDKPEEKSIQWAHESEGLKQLKQRRMEAEHMRNKQPNQR